MSASPATAMPLAHGRVREFDGLRAFAIAGVLGIHLRGDLAPGGHLGVSVFFVLSGYLITTLLVRERRDTGRVHFWNFYVRRAARLFPALIIVVIIGSAIFLTSQPPAHVVTGAAAALFYVTDFVAAIWGWQALGHFEFAWTLSLEEQFYLVWPLLLLLIGRWRALPIALTAALVLASEAFRFGPMIGSPPTMFFAPHTRMSGIVLGALLALLLHGGFRLPGWASQILGTVALLCIVVGFRFAGTDTPSTYTIWIPVVEIASAALILSIVSARSWFSPLLTWRPAAYLGLISYGVYLWNIPVVLLLGHLMKPGPVQTVSELVLTIGVAAASFHFIERPAGRIIRHRFSKTAVKQPV